MSSAYMSCVAVELPRGGSVEDLVSPRSVAAVFTLAEYRASAAGRSLESWGGRFAAKLAVAEVLDLDLAEPHILSRIEVLPKGGGRCTDGRRCALGHPPAVAVTGNAAEALRSTNACLEVSIAHERALAVAVALLKRRPQSKGPQ
jgi:phosphopantetheinyl transferase (holo-ACP synthase)